MVENALRGVLLKKFVRPASAVSNGAPNEYDGAQFREKCPKCAPEKSEKVGALSNISCEPNERAHNARDLKKINNQLIFLFQNGSSQ
jgi:hypothetical protein